MLNQKYQYMYKGLSWVQNVAPSAQGIAHYCCVTQMQSAMFKYIGFHVTLFQKNIIRIIFSEMNH